MPPIREKMHRLPPESYRGEVRVAFTCCVADRFPLFADADVVKVFLGLLRVATEKHHCTILIYCFMPDHLHLILRGNSADSDVRQAVIVFKQSSGFWLKQHRPDVHWQKDFYDHIIRRDEDLGAQIRYIAANPVRKGLVNDWQEYPHTGAIGVDLGGVIDGTITL
jgi:putative transposase